MLVFLGLSETLYGYKYLKKNFLIGQSVSIWFKYLSDTYQKKEQDYFKYDYYCLQNY